MKPVWVVSGVINLSTYESDQSCLDPTHLYTPVHGHVTNPSPTCRWVGVNHIKYCAISR